MRKQVINFYYNLEGAALLTQWKLYGRFMKDTAGSLMLRAISSITGLMLVVLFFKVVKLNWVYSLLIGLIPIAILVFYLNTKEHRGHRSLEKIEDFRLKGKLIKIAYLLYVILVFYILPISLIVLAIIKRNEH